MKIVIQRVLNASVFINNSETSHIKEGLLIYLGITHTDSETDAEYLVKKLIQMRIFGENPSFDKSIQELNLEVLVISQFTLCANTQKGRRPSFSNAAPPKQAKILYEYFINCLKNHSISVQTGVFQSTMQVSSINDGPVTIVIDTNDVKRLN